MKTRRELDRDIEEIRKSAAEDLRMWQAYESRQEDKLTVTILIVALIAFAIVACLAAICKP